MLGLDDDDCECQDNEDESQDDGGDGENEKPLTPEEERQEDIKALDFLLQVAAESKDLQAQEEIYSRKEILEKQQGIDEYIAAEEKGKLGKVTDKKDYEWAQNTVDFMRGWGDTLSLGLSQKLRENLYGEAGEVLSRKAYFGGQAVGIVHSTLMGGYGAASAAGRGATVLVPQLATAAATTGARVILINGRAVVVSAEAFGYMGAAAAGGLTTYNASKGYTYKGLRIWKGGKGSRTPGKRFCKNKPHQDHHISTRYRPFSTSAKMLKKYKIGLEDKLNKVRQMLHSGTHPEKYKQWINRLFKNADNLSKGDAAKFTNYVEKIGEYIKKHPDVVTHKFAKTVKGKF